MTKTKLLALLLAAALCLPFAGCAKITDEEALPGRRRTAK